MKKPVPTSEFKAVAPITGIPTEPRDLRVIPRIKDRSKSPKIFLVCGKNLYSLLALNALIPNLLKMGFEPHVFLTPGSKLEAAQTAFLQYMAGYTAFEQGSVWDEVLRHLEINPAYDSATQGLIKNVFYTFSQLEHAYGVKIENVESINSPIIRESIEGDPNFFGVISFKNYSIAHQEFLDTIKRKRLGNDIEGSRQIEALAGSRCFAINIHSALLPDWQGVYLTPRLALSGSSIQGYTAHEMIYDPALPQRGIDAGGIIDSKSVDFDIEGSSIIESDLGFLTKHGIGFILATIDNIIRYAEQTKTMRVQHQDPSDAHYHTFPTDEEFQELEKRGIPLVNPVTFIDWIANTFSKPGTTHHEKLRNMAFLAVSKWERLVKPKLIGEIITIPAPANDSTPI